MKIGVLLPSSKLYPTLMVDFSAGLRMAFAELKCEGEIELVFEGIHQGTDKNLILNGINKLVIQHQTEVNILFCNYLLIEDIAASINALQRPLILTNMGGNLPSLFEPGEFIFMNSFGLWESAHLAARWAVNEFGKRAAHGSYFYEAGFGLYASFCEGLTSVGGEVVLNQISDFNPNPDDFDNFMKQASVESPDFLYALYSERDAVNFLTKLSSSAENGVYPIVTSGVLLNDEILDKINGVPERIYNVSSWDSSDDTPENFLFMESYKHLTGNNANYFALLGYECAASICSGMNQKGWTKNGRNQADALKNISFSSPRGILNYRNALNSTSAEHHVYELNDGLKRRRKESLGKLELMEQIIDKSKTDNVAQGWYQPYLCQ